MSVLPKHSTPAVPNDFLFLDANGNVTRIGLDDLKSLVKELPANPSDNGTYYLKLVKSADGVVLSFASEVKELPTFPTTAGNYHLKAVVDSEGATTLSWVTLA